MKLSEKEHKTVLISLICQERIIRFAEIGVYEGRLMRDLLRSPAGQILEEYYAIDQWLESDKQWRGKKQADWDGLHDHACKYLPHFHQLRIIRMNSVKASHLFWDKFFDMVYIDADHSYEAAKRDITAWFPKVRKGGILAGHDYDPWSRKINSQVKKAVDEVFGEENIEKLKCSVWLHRKEI